VFVATVFKLSSNVNVQVVRSMLDLNDILSLIAKRRSRFLCRPVILIVFLFFKIILFCTSLYVVSFFNFYISCDVVFLLYFVFVYLCVSCAAIILRIKLSIFTLLLDAGSRLPQTNGT